MAYNKQIWKDEIPDLTKPIRDASGKQKTDPQTGRPLYELVQEGTRITSDRLNHMEGGIDAAHNSAEQKADAALAAAKTYTDTGLLSKADKSSTYTKIETDERIQAVVGAAPEALDTLKEIGDALNNDPNFAATMTNQLSGKVDKVPGKQLSTEDFSPEEKAKLAGLTTGAGGAGSATDTVIGNRTIVDTEAPASDSAPPTKLWSWLGYMIRAITGKSSWRTAPAITLEATKIHVDEAGPGIHGSTSAATARKLIHRDDNGRAKIAVPAAADDIARKDTVDVVQTNLNTHAGDTTAHVTAAERTNWNGKLASSSYTAPDVLEKLLTVDGSGSGLDAGLLGGLLADAVATGNTIVARDTNGNVAASSLRLADTGRIATTPSMSAGGQGGIIQMTSDIASASGYGVWMCYNCYWDGINWIQPRGTLPSFAYTVNNHRLFSWRFAAATGTHGSVITLTEIAVMDSSGAFKAAQFKTINSSGLAVLLEGTAALSTAIHLNNTTASTGRKYSIYSNALGHFVIGDEAAALARLTISPSGQVNAPVLFSALAFVAQSADKLDSLTMDYFAATNIFRLRQGGNGSASMSAFEIQGPSDVMRMRLEGDGRVQFAGAVTAPGLNLTGPSSRRFTGSNLDTKRYENVFYASNSSASVTGTIKITLPKSWNNTMMRIKISGYNYNSSHGAWELLLGGYNFTGGSGQWYNTSAVLTGAAPFTSVRFAHDGTNCCILLGVTASVWNYPKIVIEEFTATSGAIDGWESGWSIAIVTDETGITVSGTPTLNAGTNVDMLDGAHADSAATQSTVAKRDGNGSLTAKVFISTVAQGAAPMAVGSDTKVEKLHADILDGVHASGAADPTTIPVRSSTKKIAEVAANRAVAKDIALTTATTTIATYTPAVAGLYTVKISAGLSTAAGITINVSYTGPRGAKSVSVVAEYSLAADDYYFVPVTFFANAGVAISVTASSTTTGAAWASAVITEEG